MSIILFLQMGPGWLMSAACVAAGLRHKKQFFFSFKCNSGQITTIISSCPNTRVRAVNKYDYAKES